MDNGQSSLRIFPVYISIHGFNSSSLKRTSFLCGPRIALQDSTLSAPLESDINLAFLSRIPFTTDSSRVRLELHWFFKALMRSSH